jgi:ketosteroid isomerase-like protein
MPDIELIKAGLAAYNEGNFERFLDRWDEDAEVRRLGGAGTLRGKEAIRSWLAPDAMEYQRGEPIEFRENGERVLVACDWHFRGRGSGIEADTRVFLLFTLRGDKVIRLENYRDENEALEAAGLRK